MVRRWRRWVQRVTMPMALVALVAGTGCDIKDLSQHEGTIKAFLCNETVFHGRQTLTTFYGQTPHTDGDCDQWNSRVQYAVFGGGYRWTSWSVDPYGYTYVNTTSSPNAGHYVCDYGVCAYAES